MQFLTFLTFFPPNFSFCALLQAAAYINNDPTNMTDTVLDVSVMHMEAILCTLLCVIPISNLICMHMKLLLRGEWQYKEIVFYSWVHGKQETGCLVHGSLFSLVNPFLCYRPYKVATKGHIKLRISCHFQANEFLLVVTKC